MRHANRQVYVHYLRKDSQLLCQLNMFSLINIPCTACDYYCLRLSNYHRIYIFPAFFKIIFKERHIANDDAITHGYNVRSYLLFN